jgi:hypothetical protein
MYFCPNICTVIESFKYVSKPVVQSTQFPFFLLSLQFSFSSCSADQREFQTTQTPMLIEGNCECESKRRGIQVVFIDALFPLSSGQFQPLDLGRDGVDVFDAFSFLSFF